MAHLAARRKKIFGDRVLPGADVVIAETCATIDAVARIASVCVSPHEQGGQLNRRSG